MFVLMLVTVVAKLLTRIGKCVAVSPALLYFVILALSKFANNLLSQSTSSVRSKDKLLKYLFKYMCKNIN